MFLSTQASRKERQGRKEGRKLCCKIAAPGFRQAVDDSLDSVLEADFAEINQQAKVPVAQPKLSEQLFAVNRNQLLHGFELDDDLVLHEQISAETFIERKLVVMDLNRNLTLNSQAPLFQLVRQDDLVNRFEQSRPRLGMNLESGVQNQFGDLIFAKSRDGILHDLRPCRHPSRSSSPLLSNKHCELRVLGVRND